MALSTLAREHLHHRRRRRICYEVALAVLRAQLCGEANKLPAQLQRNMARPELALGREKQPRPPRMNPMHATRTSGVLWKQRDITLVLHIRLPCDLDSDVGL